MPNKAQRETVNVDRLDLRHHRANASGRRLDHYWRGTVQINAQTFAVLFHVWRDDGHSKRHGWLYCLDVNPDKQQAVGDHLMRESCDKCGGERNADGSYRGRVARALYNVFADFAGAQGFPPAADGRKSWFTFSSALRSPVPSAGGIQPAIHVRGLPCAY